MGAAIDAKRAANDSDPMVERPYRSIRVTESDGVAALTMYRPERKNALSPSMVSELLYAIEDALAAPAIRSLVLTGEGSVFCAGGDFSQMSGEAPPDELAPRGDYADLLLAMVRSTKPIVARVNGHALGGGIGLVAASTFAIGSTDAKLGTPEINVGLFPMMAMAVIARVVPRRKLMEMMLLGERMTAAAAVDVGLLSAAVEPASLDEAVRALTKRIAEKSPIALRLGLAAFAEQDGRDLEEALPVLRDRLGGVLGTHDAREGLLAFLEKRPPVWTGS